MLRNIIKVTSNRLSISLRYYSDAQTININEKVQNNISTIDKQEISNFKKLNGIWWDENGEMKALHSMNALRVPFIRDGLKNCGKLNEEYINTSTPLKKLKILEVGCGGGILSEPLARLGANVVGLDACKDLIECAKLHAEESLDKSLDLTYIHGSVEDLGPELTDKFDAVVSSECIEHVVAKEVFLQSCVKVLKPGGSLFLTTINKTKLSYILGIIAAENILKIVPKGTHDWEKFIPPREIQNILEHNNTQMRLLHGMIYNFLTNKWYWVPDTSLNFALHAVKNV